MYSSRAGAVPLRRRVCLSLFAAGKVWQTCVLYHIIFHLSTLSGATKFSRIFRGIFVIPLAIFRAARYNKSI